MEERQRRTDAPSPGGGGPEGTSHVECSGGRIRAETPIGRSPLRAEEEKAVSHRGQSMWCYWQGMLLGPTQNTDRQVYSSLSLGSWSLVYQKGARGRRHRLVWEESQEGPKRAGKPSALSWGGGMGKGSWAGESRAVSDRDKSRKRKIQSELPLRAWLAATGPFGAGKGSVGPVEVQAGLRQVGSVAGRHSSTIRGFHPKLSRLSPKVSTVSNASGQNVR